MSTSRLRAAAALTFAAFVVACGSSDNGPSFVNAADSATIADLAADANEIIGNSFNNTYQSGDPSIPLLVKGVSSTAKSQIAIAAYQRVAAMIGLHRGITLAAPRSRPALSAPFAECTPTETGVGMGGDPVDTDADGVPDNYKVDFGSACVSEDSAGTYHDVISGFLQFQEFGSGFYGFKITIGHLKFVETDLTTGEVITFSINGSETFNAATALATHSMNWTLGFSDQTTGDPVITYTVSDGENSSFDPDDGLNLAMGNPLPNGVLDMNVDLRFLGASGATAEDGNFRILLDTPTPVHYNTACGNDIDAGQLRGLLNGRSTVGFTATWSSCGDPVIVIFGASAPTAVAAR